MDGNGDRKASTAEAWFGMSSPLATLTLPWRIAANVLIFFGISWPAIGRSLDMRPWLPITLQLACLFGFLFILRKAGAVRAWFIAAFFAVPLGIMLAIAIGSRL